MAKLHIKVTRSGKRKSKQQVKKDVSEMTRKELAKELRPLFHMANARLSRIESANAVSPAAKAVEKNGGKFYLRGKSLNELRHEYARVMAFLNMETSTLGGAHAYEARMKSMLGGTYSESMQSLIFDTFRKVQELNPTQLQVYDSHNLIQSISQDIVERVKGYENDVNKIDAIQQQAIQRAIDYITNTYYDRMKELDKAFQKLNK